MNLRAPLLVLFALVAAGLAVVAVSFGGNGLLTLIPAAIFAGAAYLAYAQLPSPRPWLLLAVLALLASFVPWPAFLDRRGLLVNLLLTLLAAGSLYANVKGEQRRLRGEERRTP